MIKDVNAKEFIENELIALAIDTIQRNTYMSYCHNENDNYVFINDNYKSEDGLTKDAVFTKSEMIQYGKEALEDIRSRDYGYME